MTGSYHPRSGRFAKCPGALPGQVNITRSEIFAVELEMLGELLTNYGPIYELVRADTFSSCVCCLWSSCFVVTVP
jgi:hypothetical protein